MTNKFNLPVIIDGIIRDVTIKVAKLDLCSYDPANFSLKNGVAVVTTIIGNYTGKFVFSSDIHVIRGISENMKREHITEEAEVEIYTIEFFNILCGRIITALSNRSRMSARFNIPQVLLNSHTEIESDGITRYEWYYGSRYGPMRIQMGLKRI